MKIKLRTTQEYDVKYLLADAGVRYWEDATVNGEVDVDGSLIPCREGDMWKPIIDIDEGKIVNWEIGKVARIHYKVCDDGTYYLCDNEKNVICEYDGYVPNIMRPEGNGWGDYIIMNVNSDGYIDKFTFSLDGFENYCK
jgi:hypothetical protein